MPKGIHRYGLIVVLAWACSSENERERVANRAGAVVIDTNTHTSTGTSLSSNSYSVLSSYQMGEGDGSSTDPSLSHLQGVGSSDPSGENLEIESEGGVKLNAVHTPAKDGSKNRIMVLIHGKGSNLHSYDTIVMILTSLGYATLAVDLRAGGSFEASENLTVKNQGKSEADLRKVVPDVNAAIAHAYTEHGYEQVAVMATDLGAALALKAVANGAAAKKILVFSPDEYLPNESVAGYAGKVKIPLFVAAPVSEKAKIDKVLAQCKGANLQKSIDSAGSSGLNILSEKKVFLDFQTFLSR